MKLGDLQQALSGQNTSGDIQAFYQRCRTQNPSAARELTITELFELMTHSVRKPETPEKAAVLTLLSLEREMSLINFNN